MSSKPKSKGKKDKKKALPPAFTGIAVGKNSGFQVTRRLMPRQPSTYKGIINKKRALVKNVISEVAGFAPYEKRLIDLMKNNLDKRALRLAKRKVKTNLSIIQLLSSS